MDNSSAWMMRAAAPDGLFGVPFQTTPGPGIFGQLPSFGQINPSPATIGGLPVDVTRAYPPSGDLVFGPQDYPIAEDPLLKSQIEVIKFENVGIHRNAVAGEYVHVYGQLVILLGPKRGSPLESHVPSLEQRIKRARMGTSDLEPASMALFDRVSASSRFAVEDKLSPRIAIPTVADTDPISKASPIAHYSVAFGAITEVRTYNPLDVETCLNVHITGHTEHAKTLWAYLEANVEPYKSGLRGHQLAQCGSSLSVFPVLHPDIAAGDHEIHYMPAIGLTRDQAIQIERMLRHVNGDIPAFATKCSRVYRIGTLAQSFCRSESHWVVSISPALYYT